MSGVSLKTPLQKLQEAITDMDRILEVEPAVNSPLEEWQSWREQADNAELTLKQRLAGINNRTIPDEDSAKVSRIRHEVAKARENYENAQWIAGDERILPPDSAPTTELKQEPSESGDEPPDHVTTVHPPSAVSAPMVLHEEKKLGNPVIYNPPCEACRSDDIPCIREYVRRGRVRCDRCVIHRFRCSFPSDRFQPQSAQTTILNPELSRPQRKRTILINKDNAEPFPLSKRARLQDSQAPTDTTTVVADGDTPIIATPQQIERQVANIAKNPTIPSSSANSGTDVLNSVSLSAIDRKAFVKMVERERDSTIQKTNMFIEEAFDRLIQEIERAS